MAATNVQAFSGDVVLGEATYRYKKSWTAGTGGKAYVYMGNVKSTDTSGIRINFTAGTNPGVTMIDISSTLHNLDTGHAGGNMINFIHGNAPGAPSDSIDLGYVYVSADSSYQLWIEDPTDDTLGTVTAYINCQGYYNYDTTVSDVAQGGAAPTNFQRGVAALAIEKGGTVGIGTNDTTASSQLEIRGPTSPAINQGQVVIGYKELGTEDSNVIAVQFRGYNGSEDTPLGSIQIERESTTNGNNDTRMLLYTRADGGNQQEAVRMTSEQKVGIGGITSPAESLEVSGNYRAGRTTGGYTFGLDSGGALKAGIYSNANNPLIFRTGTDSEKMRILNSGNTGIGTDTPGDLLELHSTGGSDNVGMIVGNGDRKWRVGIRGDTSDSFAIQDDTAGAIRASCNASGVWSFPQGLTGDVSGNASTATALETARTINGTSFNGTANIVVEPYISDDNTGDTSCYLVFTLDTTAGYKRLYEDSALVYNNTNNALTVGGTVSAGFNTNTTSYFGRAAVGYTGHNDWASLSHIDQNTLTGFAIAQNSSGRTNVNAASGQPIEFNINDVPKMTLNSSGRLGIGISPTEDLHVYDGTSTARIIVQRGSNNGESNLTLNGYHSSGTTEWQIYHAGANSPLYFWRGTNRGFISFNAANNSLNFTGQHRTFIKDIPFSEASKLEGLIVSANNNNYIKMSGGIAAGANAITINECLPIVSISNVEKDKKCFGVVSLSEDPESRQEVYGNFVSIDEKEDGDTRVYINSVGEGAMWISNINGNLESGDYITTSNIPGYGQKQDDDLLHNYTVAKITMDCNFNPTNAPVRVIKKKMGTKKYWKRTINTKVSLERYTQLPEDSRYTESTLSYYDYKGEKISKSEYDQLDDEQKTSYTVKEDIVYYEVEIEYTTEQKEQFPEMVMKDELINDLNEYGEIQWEDDPTGATEKAYKIRYLDANGVETNETNHVYKAAFVGCTYHCG